MRAAFCYTLSIFAARAECKLEIAAKRTLRVALLPKSRTIHLSAASYGGKGHIGRFPLPILHTRELACARSYFRIYLEAAALVPLQTPRLGIIRYSNIRVSRITIVSFEFRFPASVHTFFFFFVNYSSFFFILILILSIHS